MKTTNIESPGIKNDAPADAQPSACHADGKDCGCGNGLCPGTILAGVALIGWGLWALGSWVWSLIAG